MLEGRSIVLVDARGDLCEAIIELAARVGADPALIKYFDLSDASQPLGYNPLGGGRAEPHQYALGALEAIGGQHENMGPQLSEYLRFGLQLLSEADGRLTHLQDLFYDDALRQQLISRAKTERIKEFWHRFGSLPQEKKGALAAPVLNKVSLLFSTESLRRVLGHSHPVDLGGQLDTPRSITIINLAVNQLNAAGWTLGQMFLSSICREVFSRTGVPESERNAITLYVDEFESYSMDIFEAVLAEGRRFAFSLVLAHQSLAQLTPKMRALVLGNVSTKLVFRVAHNDATILNKDLTGDAKAFDLARLKVGEAVLWRKGEEPFEVEVNAPLISDIGRTTPHAQALLDRLEELKTKHTELGSPIIESDRSSELNEPPKRIRSKKVQSLEDWL
jgi:hypothetical protein